MRDKLEQVRREIDALAPGTETRVYVDTGPIVERAFARFSGIGWMGKNTCLINERKGSWFFLGVVLSSLALSPDLAAPDRCGSCTRCLEACPTGALVRPYMMDASRCIAYLTIEQKGSIPTELRSPIGLNVFGCDICQDVCPWNSFGHKQQSRGFHDRHSEPRGAATSRCPEFQPVQIETRTKNGQEALRLQFRARSAGLQPGISRNADLKVGATSAAALESEAAEKALGQTAKDRRAEDSSRSPLGSDIWNERANSVSLFNPPLRALASVDEESFHRAFSRSPIKRAKYRGWLRNLCVAIGNSGDTSLVPWLERASEHPDGIIREHACWALEMLRNPKS
jgi:epoxyqueuosine reductase QueG